MAHEVVGQLSFETVEPILPPEPAPVAAPAIADGPAREVIEHQLGTTLFVEAGAGAGKTHELSTRVVNLVASGVDITEIAAITFTEKAAAELRHRIRADLRRRLTEPQPGDTPELAGAFRQAIERLDHAAVGTLHAFATRLLREFPTEAGVPPSFRVLDEVGSDIAFDLRWTTMLDDLLADPDHVRLVHFAESGDIRIKGLRRIARAFADNWDLVRDRVALDVEPPPPLDVGGFLGDVLELVETTEVPPADSTAGALAELGRWALDATRAIDEFAGYQLLDTKFPMPKGNKQNWKSTPMGEAGLAALRAAAAQLSERRDELLGAHRQRWQARIGAVIGRFTLDSVDERRAQGELEFHDLLVLARDLVAHHGDVRSRLHARYRRLLLDEFQDTDPIQMELAVRIAADPTEPQGRDWRDLVPVPGRLFFVGDPKQSIYRFRRADIGQYLQARDQVGAEPVLLTTNFRSTPQVLGWVNHVFGDLIRPEPGSQPAFHPLTPAWPDRTGSVTVLGVTAHDDKPRADELRAREAADVVAAIRTALHQGWPVHRKDGTSRPCVLGDITVLLPSRTPLPALESALLAAGIPYQAENSSLVYATSEIRSLLLALRAIDDPSDELAVAATLRSELYGCSDRDLFAWFQRGGRWRLTAPLPEPRSGPAPSDDPVLEAFTSLRAMARERHLLTPSALLQRIVEERRVLELAVGSPGARDVFRRVRFVIDQARAWSDAGGAGLRSYLAWTRRQGDDGRYVAEVVLPETDLEAVRIMTIHAAKGLEFPVTIVSGLTTRMSSNRGTTVVWTPDSWGLTDGDEHEAFKPVDEQMSHHERLRLLYVACTRAADHLVVSLHRLPVKPDARSGATASQLLAAVGEHAPFAVPLDPSAIPPDRPAEELLELPWSDPAAWADARKLALDAARRPRTLSATSIAVRIDAESGGWEEITGVLAPDDLDRLVPPGLPATPDGFDVDDLPDDAIDPGLLKDGVDLELPPWQRGRYGTAVGRAVHGVLQAVDLATGAHLDDHAAAQASAEGISDQVALVAALARAALASPTVQAAATSPHWRELFVAAPVGETLIEGYLDLLVRTPQGLVIVDYKTDHVSSPAELAAKVRRYGPQLAVYGVAVEAVLGEPVVGARLVLCAVAGATEVAVPDWPGELAAMRARLSPGGDATSVGTGGAGS